MKNAARHFVTTLMVVIVLALTAGQSAIALQQAQAGEALTWRRTGGIAGLCDELTVYVTGEVHLASCKGGESVVTHQRHLPIEQLKQLYTWIGRYRAWEMVERDLFVADGFTFHTVFVGTGTAEPTPEEKQEITAFAAMLFEEASAPEASPYQAIAIGSTLSGTIKGATEEFFSYHGYRVDVPANTSHLAIQVDSQGHDLDLAVKFGSELSSWDEGEVDFSDFTEGTNPSYTVSNPPVGPLYFEVINPIMGEPGNYSVTVATGATGAEAETTSTPEPHAPPPGNAPEPPPGELLPSESPQPPGPEHSPETMEAFQSPLSASIPDGWLVEESITLSSPDGTANVIVSDRPLDAPMTAHAYAEAHSDLLADFPEYQELEFVETQVFGGRTGYLRHFEWTPEGSERVTQIQLYYTENGRAYTATATTTTASFEELEPQLRQVLGELRIEPRTTSLNHPQGETSQRTEGPTPNGGAYAIAYFRDENGDPTTKDQAHSVEIVEYNEKGEAIHSTFGYLNQ
jgi:hypothetical protein